MGTVDLLLAAELRDELDLGRAVETGTYQGGTTRALASVFRSVLTIELSAPLHLQAEAALSDLRNVTALRGHSGEVLKDVARDGFPTLYFLDGHWSGGRTEGVEDECPVLDELAAIGAGHEDDCLIIDDARLFTSAPQAPHDAAQWPTIIEVFDAIRVERPNHSVTVLFDQVVAVPLRAKAIVDAYGGRRQATPGLGRRALRALVDGSKKAARRRWVGSSG